MAVPKKQKNKGEQEDEKRLEALLGLLEKLSIQVKYARGYFRGGLVRYRDQLFLYLNRTAKAQNKVDVIVNELQYIEIPPHLLTPELRKILTIENSDSQDKKTVNKQNETVTNS